ncbi:hypothetical protein PanWU01x14_356170 [Parasponia andersonii]|uniref:Uncharacterized protein n=1 Tax=Parasponia andersonii TaxID=3476 RepID=A0A2P5A929_PARAD|nr:hypothetical protein PanWU01x14_356170 [Parasponia andersonii]
MLPRHSRVWRISRGRSDLEDNILIQKRRLAGELGFLVSSIVSSYAIWYRNFFVDHVSMDRNQVNSLIESLGHFLERVRIGELAIDSLWRIGRSSPSSALSRISV